MTTKPHALMGIDTATLARSSGADALKVSGINFGNLLFTQAVKNQVHRVKHVGYGFNPSELEEKYASIVVAAANWINVKTDWGWLAERLERVRIPVSIIGLGTQLERVSDVRQVPAGTGRLLRLISERSRQIGLRGEFSANVVSEMGIRNFEVLGCPSMFLNCNIPAYRDSWQNRLEKHAVSGTRFALNKSHLRTLSPQRKLYSYGLRSADIVVYQSEELEIRMLSGSATTEQEALATDYYQLDQTARLRRLVTQKGRYFTKLKPWLSELSSVDYYLGSRIHGAVAAILARTPALLLYHDNRTRELGETMGIPSADLDAFDLSLLQDKSQLEEILAPDKLKLKSQHNFMKLRQFYCDNSIEHNLGQAQ